MIRRRIVSLAIALIVASSASAGCPVKWQVGTDWSKGDQEKPYFAVHTLQEALNFFGRAGIKVDGDLGHSTRRALLSFQKQHGLPQTGMPDKATLSKLEALYRKLTPVPPIATNPNRAIYNPDFTASAEARGGSCMVTLTWLDETREIRLPLSRGVANCRLAEFKGRPVYLQALGQTGIPVDIVGPNYPPYRIFLEPVVVVYPDREIAMNVESIEHRRPPDGDRQKIHGFVERTDVFERSKLLGFPIGRGPAFPRIHHNGWVQKNWTDHQCHP